MSKPSEDFEYICRTYAVPACKGRRVIASGEPGVITGVRNAHILVRLDSESPNSKPSPYHPTWEMEYGEMAT